MVPTWLLIFFLSISQVTCLRIVCYYTNWSASRPNEGHFTPADIDPNLCTHIIFAYARIVMEGIQPVGVNDENTNTTVGFYERVTSLKIINPQLKILLGVNGWNTRFPPQYSTWAVASPSFVQSTIDFLRQREFDGIDLDWEYSSRRRGLPTTKDGFTELLKELNDGFEAEAIRTGKPRLLLTAAVTARKSDINGRYDVRNMTRYLDFLNVMSYDFHGPWKSTLGHSSPLHARDDQLGDSAYLNTEAAINYWIQMGADKEKLVVGIPFYGRTFTVMRPNMTKIGDQDVRVGPGGPFTMENGFMAFYEICQLLRDGATRVWHSQHKAPYLIRRNTWISYDDAISVMEKAKWIESQKLGGAMVWSLDLDDFSGKFCNDGRYPLLNEINKQFKKNQPIKTVVVSEPDTNILHDAWRSMSFETKTNLNTGSQPGMTASLETGRDLMINTGSQPGMRARLESGRDLMTMIDTGGVGLRTDSQTKAVTKNFQSSLSPSGDFLTGQNSGRMEIKRADSGIQFRTGEEVLTNLKRSGAAGMGEHTLRSDINMGMPGTLDISKDAGGAFLKGVNTDTHISGRDFHVASPDITLSGGNKFQSGKETSLEGILSSSIKTVSDGFNVDSGIKAESKTKSGTQADFVVSAENMQTVRDSGIQVGVIGNGQTIKGSKTHFSSFGIHGQELGEGDVIVGRQTGKNKIDRIGGIQEKSRKSLPLSALGDDFHGGSVGTDMQTNTLRKEIQSNIIPGSGYMIEKGPTGMDIKQTGSLDTHHITADKIQTDKIAGFEAGIGAAEMRNDMRAMNDLSGMFPDSNIQTSVEASMQTGVVSKDSQTAGHGFSLSEGKAIKAGNIIGKAGILGSDFQTFTAGVIAGDKTGSTVAVGSDFPAEPTETFPGALGKNIQTFRGTDIQAGDSQAIKGDTFAFSLGQGEHGRGGVDMSHKPGKSFTGSQNKIDLIGFQKDKRGFDRVGPAFVAETGPVHPIKDVGIDLHSTITQTETQLKVAPSGGVLMDSGATGIDVKRTSRLDSKIITDGNIRMDKLSNSGTGMGEVGIRQDLHSKKGHLSLGPHDVNSLSSMKSKMKTDAFSRGSQDTEQGMKLSEQQAFTTGNMIDRHSISGSDFQTLSGSLIVDGQTSQVEGTANFPTESTGIAHVASVQNVDTLKKTTFQASPQADSKAIKSGIFQFGFGPNGQDRGSTGISASHITGNKIASSHGITDFNGGQVDKIGVGRENEIFLQETGISQPMMEVGMDMHTKMIRKDASSSGFPMEHAASGMNVKRTGHFDSQIIADGTNSMNKLGSIDTEKGVLGTRQEVHKRKGDLSLGVLDSDFQAGTKSDMKTEIINRGSQVRGQDIQLAGEQPYITDNVIGKGGISGSNFQTYPGSFNIDGQTGSATHMMLSNFPTKSTGTFTDGLKQNIQETEFQAGSFGNMQDNQGGIFESHLGPSGQDQVGIDMRETYTAGSQSIIDVPGRPVVGEGVDMGAVFQTKKETGHLMKELATGQQSTASKQDLQSNLAPLGGFPIKSEAAGISMERAGGLHSQLTAEGNIQRKSGSEMGVKVVGISKNKHAIMGDLSIGVHDSNFKPNIKKEIKIGASDTAYQETGQDMKLSEGQPFTTGNIFGKESIAGSDFQTLPRRLTTDGQTNLATGMRLDSPADPTGTYPESSAKDINTFQQSSFRASQPGENQAMKGGTFEFTFGLSGQGQGGADIIGSKITEKGFTDSQHRTDLSEGRGYNGGVARESAVFLSETGTGQPMNVVGKTLHVTSSKMETQPSLYPSGGFLIESGATGIDKKRTGGFDSQITSEGNIQINQKGGSEIGVGVVGISTTKADLSMGVHDSNLKQNMKTDMKIRAIDTGNQETRQVLKLSEGQPFITGNAFGKESIAGSDFQTLSGRLTSDGQTNLAAGIQLDLPAESTRTYPDSSANDIYTFQQTSSQADQPRENQAMKGGTFEFSFGLSGQDRRGSDIMGRKITEKGVPGGQSKTDLPGGQVYKGGADGESAVFLTETGTGQPVKVVGKDLHVTSTNLETQSNVFPSRGFQMVSGAAGKDMKITSGLDSQITAGSNIGMAYKPGSREAELGVFQVRKDAQVRKDNISGVKSGTVVHAGDVTRSDFKTVADGFAVDSTKNLASGVGEQSITGSVRDASSKSFLTHHGTDFPTSILGDGQVLKDNNMELRFGQMQGAADVTGGQVMGETFISNRGIADSTGVVFDRSRPTKPDVISLTVTDKSGQNVAEKAEWHKAMIDSGFQSNQTPLDSFTTERGGAGIGAKTTRGFDGHFIPKTEPLQDKKTASEVGVDAAMIDLKRLSRIGQKDVQRDVGNMDFQAQGHDLKLSVSESLKSGAGTSTSVVSGSEFQTLTDGFHVDGKTNLAAGMDANFPAELAETVPDLSVQNIQTLGGIDQPTNLPGEHMGGNFEISFGTDSQGTKAIDISGGQVSHGSIPNNQGLLGQNRGILDGSRTTDSHSISFMTDGKGRQGEIAGIDPQTGTIRTEMKSNLDHSSNFLVKTGTAKTDIKRADGLSEGDKLRGETDMSTFIKTQPVDMQIADSTKISQEWGGQFLARKKVNTQLHASIGGFGKSTDSQTLTDGFTLTAEKNKPLVVEKEPKASLSASVFSDSQATEMIVKGQAGSDAQSTARGDTQIVGMTIGESKPSITTTRKDINGVESVRVVQGVIGGAEIGTHTTGRKVDLDAAGQEIGLLGQKTFELQAGADLQGLTGTGKFHGQTEGISVKGGGETATGIGIDTTAGTSNAAFDWLAGSAHSSGGSEIQTGMIGKGNAFPEGGTKISTSDRHGQEGRPSDLDIGFIKSSRLGSDQVIYDGQVKGGGPIKDNPVDMGRKTTFGSNIMSSSSNFQGSTSHATITGDTSLPIETGTDIHGKINFSEQQIDPGTMASVAGKGSTVSVTEIHFKGREETGPKQQVQKQNLVGTAQFEKHVGLDVPSGPVLGGQFPHVKGFSVESGMSAVNIQEPDSKYKLDGEKGLNLGRGIDLRTEGWEGNANVVGSSNLAGGGGDGYSGIKTETVSVLETGSRKGVPRSDSGIQIPDKNNIGGNFGTAIKAVVPAEIQSNIIVGASETAASRIKTNTQFDSQEKGFVGKEGQGYVQTVVTGTTDLETGIGLDSHAGVLGSDLQGSASEFQGTFRQDFDVPARTDGNVGSSERKSLMFDQKQQVSGIKNRQSSTVSEVKTQPDEKTILRQVIIPQGEPFPGESNLAVETLAIRRDQQGPYNGIMTSRNELQITPVASGSQGATSVLRTAPGTGFVIDSTVSKERPIQIGTRVDMQSDLIGRSIPDTYQQIDIVHDQATQIKDTERSLKGILRDASITGDGVQMDFGWNNQPITMGKETTQAGVDVISFAGNEGDIGQSLKLGTHRSDIGDKIQRAEGATSELKIVEPRFLNKGKESASASSVFQSGTNVQSRSRLNRKFGTTTIKDLSSDPGFQFTGQRTFQPDVLSEAAFEDRRSGQKPDKTSGLATNLDARIVHHEPIVSSLFSWSESAPTFIADDHAEGNLLLNVLSSKPMSGPGVKQGVNKETSFKDFSTKMQIAGSPFARMHTSKFQSELNQFDPNFKLKMPNEEKNSVMMTGGAQFQSRRLQVDTINTHSSEPAVIRTVKFTNIPIDGTVHQRDTTAGMKFNSDRQPADGTNRLQIGNEGHLSSSIQSAMMKANQVKSEGHSAQTMDLGFTQPERLTNKKTTGSVGIQMVGAQENQQTDGIANIVTLSDSKWPGTHNTRGQYDEMKMTGIKTGSPGVNQQGGIKISGSSESGQSMKAESGLEFSGMHISGGETDGVKHIAVKSGLENQNLPAGVGSLANSGKIFNSAFSWSSNPQRTFSFGGDDPGFAEDLRMPASGLSTAPRNILASSMQEEFKTMSNAPGINSNVDMPSSSLGGESSGVLTVSRTIQTGGGRLTGTGTMIIKPKANNIQYVKGDTQLDGKNPSLQADMSKASLAGSQISAEAGKSSVGVLKASKVGTRSAEGMQPDQLRSTSTTGQRQFSVISHGAWFNPVLDPIVILQPFSHSEGKSTEIMGFNGNRISVPKHTFTWTTRELISNPNLNTLNNDQQHANIKTNQITMHGMKSSSVTSSNTIDGTSSANGGLVATNNI